MGHTKLQESENQFQTSVALRGRLAMMMGGLAAETFVFNDITQGPGHDLAAATDLAQKMVSKMGMGNSYTVVEDQSLMVNAAVSEQVRVQTEELISEAVDRAKAVIASPEWQKVFNAMREQLLNVDSIETEEIQQLKELAVGE